MLHNVKRIFVSRGVNDFRLIMYEGNRFTTENFYVECQKCLAFIKRSVSDSDIHHLFTLEVVRISGTNQIDTTREQRDTN